LSEFNKTLDQTSKKLEKLSKAKLSEAEATAHGKVLPAEFVVEKNNINKNKKTIVNLKFDDEEKKEGNLRQLLFDLENVCTLFSNNGGSEVSEGKLAMSCENVNNCQISVHSDAHHPHLQAHSRDQQQKEPRARLA
jgi:hypothetical protein